MKHRLYTSKEGSTLLLVILLTLVTAILAVGVATAILSSNAVSVRHTRTQQSYFTARSAVNAVCAKLNDSADPAFSAFVASLPENVDYTSQQGTLAQGGDYTVTLRKAGNALTVTGTGYYPSRNAPGGGYVTRTVTATLKPGGSTGTQNPMSNLLYVANGPGSSVNPAQCYGNLLINGPLTLASGSAVFGNVYVGGDLSVSNGAYVTKNAYVLGNLSMAGDRIEGDATVLGNVSFSGGGNQIRGTLSYKGSAATAWGTLASFAPNAANNAALTLTLPLAPGTVDTALPASVSAAVRSGTIRFTHSTRLVNTSGVITSCDNYADDNAPVLLDTSAGDLYLLVNRSIDLSNRQFYVTGPHRLYIYLEGSGTALSLSGGSPVIRMQDANARSTVFVIGASGTSLILHSAQLSGYAYLPDGHITIDGGVQNNGMQTGYSLIGSIAVKTATITANIPLKYSEPELTGTPLAPLLQYGPTTPPEGGAGGGWQIVSYSGT